MTEFCRNFCWVCDKCRKAIEAIHQEELILKDIGDITIKRTELERAALDHKGRP